MIKQSRIGLESRSLANPYLANGNLPLMTAPMVSVVDLRNYKEYNKQLVNVCLPRTITIEDLIKQDIKTTDGLFVSMSMEVFENFIKNYETYIFENSAYVCIDTANGNNPKLHNLIKIAKNKFENKLVIMSGNVSTSAAFTELALTGIDYIRVGIGGGSACNTTKNTGVGQIDLAVLINSCISSRNSQCLNTKIVADGISQYIKKCQTDFDFNDNGYAAINKLLNNGADLVMIGGIFAKSDMNVFGIKGEPTKHVGMSTQSFQTSVNSTIVKPSEGVSTFVQTEWTLNEWLQGSQTQDEYPYLMGFENALRSAMSYTGSKTLTAFNNSFSVKL